MENTFSFGFWVWEVVPFRGGEKDRLPNVTQAASPLRSYGTDAFRFQERSSRAAAAKQPFERDQDLLDSQVGSDADSVSDFNKSLNFSAAASGLENGNNGIYSLKKKLAV